MTTALFDAGDWQRLDREGRLTEQSPRQLPEEDRSPDEEPIGFEPENDYDTMLEGLLAALRRRLQNEQFI